MYNDVYINKFLKYSHNIPYRLIVQTIKIKFVLLKFVLLKRKFTRLVNDIGTLSYGARLKSLKLMTLAERRMRGDLIETFKVVRGFVNYGQNLFKVSRSGLNLLSRGNKVSRSRKDFLGERVVNYWNKGF